MALALTICMYASYKCGAMGSCTTGSDNCSRILCVKMGRSASGRITRFNIRSTYHRLSPLPTDT
jgi:hypothetical protein